MFSTTSIKHCNFEDCKASLQKLAAQMKSREEDLKRANGIRDDTFREYGRASDTIKSIHRSAPKRTTWTRPSLRGAYSSDYDDTARMRRDVMKEQEAHDSWRSGGGPEKDKAAQENYYRENAAKIASARRIVDEYEPKISAYKKELVSDLRLKEWKVEINLIRSRMSEIKTENRLKKQEERERGQATRESRKGGGEGGGSGSDYSTASHARAPRPFFAGPPAAVPSMAHPFSPYVTGASGPRSPRPSFARPPAAAPSMMHPFSHYATGTSGPRGPRPFFARPPAVPALETARRFPRHFADTMLAGDASESENQRLKSWLSIALSSGVIPAEMFTPVSAGKVSVLSGKGKWHTIDLMHAAAPGSMDEKCENTILLGLQRRCVLEAVAAPGCG